MIRDTGMASHTPFMPNHTGSVKIHNGSAANMNMNSKGSVTPVRNTAATVEKKMDLYCFFLSGATNQNFDKQGRINISAPLIKYAGLEKECIIIGVNDRLEVWSRDAWEQFIDENEDSLSDMADHLFSSSLNI